MTEAGSRAAIFERLAATVLRSPKIVAGAAIAAVLLALTAGFPPVIQGDLMRLIPADEPAVRALAKHRSGPSGADAVALTIPHDADIAAVATRVEQLPTVASTFHGFTGPLGLKLAILQLTPEQIDELAGGIHSAIAFRNPALVKMPDMDAALFPWAFDPLPGFQDTAGEESEPRTLYVVPTEPPEDPEFAARLLGDLETTVPEAIWIAGPHTEIAGAVREIRHDIVRTSLFSLLLVVIIVGIAFRNVAGLIILLPPLIAANVIAIAIISVTVGSLNLYTSMAGAILLGLGIDFGVHLVMRFREELGFGLSRHDAVCSAWAKTGPPCLTAALTSAAGFLVFLAADFQGLRQLGLLLAIGVLLSLLMMLLILPIFLTRVRIAARDRQLRSSPARRYSIWAAAAVVLVSVVLASALPQLQIEYDISRIRSEGLAWDELTPEQQSYRQNAFPPVIINGPDRSALHEHFSEQLNRGELQHVRAVASLDNLLPPDQDLRLAAMAGLIKTANHPRRDYLRPTMRDALHRIGKLDTEKILPGDLPAGLAHLVGASEQQVMLFLQGNMMDLRVADAMSRELDAYRERAANAFLVQASLYDVISDDLPRVAVLALLIVLLIILLDLRAPGIVAIATGSLLLGVVWAAGGLAVFDVRINIVNVVALPMLLGIGIDIVVHLLHRLRDGTSISATLRTTGVAVMISTLTTIAAFVSLTLAQNRGLQSIGFTVLIGLSAVFLAAVLIVSSTWRRVSKSDA